MSDGLWSKELGTLRRNMHWEVGLLIFCIFSRRATFTTSAHFDHLTPSAGEIVLMILPHYGDRTIKCMYIFSEVGSHSWAGKSLEGCLMALMALMADRPTGHGKR